jgi:hypothetical protein
MLGEVVHCASNAAQELAAREVCSVYLLVLLM